MTTPIVLLILFFHWIADFVLQDSDMANNKSQNINTLLMHTLIYSIIWVVVFHIAIQIGYLSMWFYLFAPITFILHTITDFFTSEIIKKKFENKEIENEIPNYGPFTMIGFDQLLHYIQLFLTYEILLLL